MSLYKKLSKVFLFLLKTLIIILGLNIFLTTLFKAIKLELKNNLETEMIVNGKKLRFDQNV